MVAEPKLLPIDGHSWLIVPAALVGQVQACWFDREYWGEAAQPLAADRGGRAPPLLLPTDPGPSVWRHYQRGGAVARLLGDRYLWRGMAQTRPWRELQVNQHLYQSGLRVPQPLAARVCRQGRWYRADLLTVQIADAQTLAQRWAAQSVAEDDWSRLGVAIAQLHAAGCDHADLNAHNLLFDQDNQLWVLDFDRAALRATGGSWGEANLSRLRRSLTKIGTSSGIKVDAGGPSAEQWQRLLDAYREKLTDQS